MNHRRAVLRTIDVVTNLSMPMSRFRISPLLSGLLFAFLAGPATVAAQTDESWVPETGDGPVFVVPIEGMIDNGLARYIDRALGDAADQEASAVIFHVDTFGGLVDAADQIRKAILGASMPTVAYIDRNAASAGALISYAADRIVMAPGSSIGAATVVEGVGGDAAPDKYQSYMRGLMRATAEANGRDPRIAEAMVDQNLEVDGVSPAGQVLTLSALEAVDLGVADAILDDLGAVTGALTANGAQLVAHEASGFERFLRFFGSPVVQSILMLMMLGGLYFELQTPGVGFPGLMAALGAILFFGPSYMTGLAESWEMLLFVIGVVLLLIEIFVIPGFGVAGITGLVLVVGSLAMALIANVGLSFPTGHAITQAVITLAVTMILMIVLAFSLSRYLPRSSRFGQLVLVPDLASAAGFTSAEAHEDLVGQHGTALTPLRPSGAADIDGRRIDVVTAGEFIESGARIRVVNVHGSRIEVRKVVSPSVDATSGD